MDIRQRSRRGTTARTNGGLQRATEVAIAGRHHMLVIGAAGTGKRRFALESARTLARERAGEQMPVRMPHASITPLGMLKWRGDASGGEIERACGGVLILEDVAEMNGPVLQGLREPLRDAQLTQANAQGTERHNVDILVIATMTWCPCGQCGPGLDTQRCSDEGRRRYAARVGRTIGESLDIVAITGTRQHDGGAMRWPETARRQAKVRRIAKTIAALEGRRALRAHHLGEAGVLSHPVLEAGVGG